MISLRQLFDRRRIGLLDYHFGRFIERLAKENHYDDPHILGLTAALLSRERSRGNSCVDLARVENPFEQDDDAVDETEVASTADIDVNISNPFPLLEQWRTLLRSAHALVSDGAIERPIVLDANDRLYLFRYFQAERGVAQKISAMVEETPFSPTSPDTRDLQDLFSLVFESQNASENGDTVNSQAVAAVSALTHRLSVIIGGPGTGKTSTVVNILKLLVCVSPHLRIGMAAPTGKAAARLSEAIREGLQSSTGIIPNQHPIPTEVRTIHRLLGYHAINHGFRYNARERLPFDVVIIDEASMVDLLVLDALFSALPDHARLILLGDKNQLPSVDTGNALWDICEASHLDHEYSARFRSMCRTLLGSEPRLHAETKETNGSNQLRDSVIELNRNYRFPAGSAIGDLARAIERRDADRTLSILQDKIQTQVALTSGQTAIDALSIGISVVRKAPDSAKASMRRVLDVYSSITKLSRAASSGDSDGQPSIARAFQLYHSARILCATRNGKMGLIQLTRHLENWLRINGQLSLEGDFYPGRPVMVTTNDYHVSLFNGDIGMCWPDEDGAIAVYFEGIKRDHTPYLRKLPVNRLPPHETAWAMTIHKSQGSQFEHVVVVLPEEPNKILSRELIYTGVTRARESVLICASPEIVRLAVDSPTRRYSGLADMIEKQ
jgi:exodeoxyribonuclease V alpha subunit